MLPPNPCSRKLPDRARLSRIHESSLACQSFPIARQLPALRRCTVGGQAAAIRGAAYYLTAELEWDTMEDLRAAFASPEGRATAADAARLRELAPVRSMIFTADRVV
jgi:uncharacterized protein (TIGR02118 family)